MSGGVAPPGGPPTPHVRCALDTRTKKFPYTIIFKLIPKFKLLHQSEVTVGPGTLLSTKKPDKIYFNVLSEIHWGNGVNETVVVVRELPVLSQMKVLVITKNITLAAT